MQTVKQNGRRSGARSRVCRIMRARLLTKAAHFALCSFILVRRRRAKSCVCTQEKYGATEILIEGAKGKYSCIQNPKWR
jgi:hypothetical protein